MEKTMYELSYRIHYPMGDKECFRVQVTAETLEDAKDFIRKEMLRIRQYDRIEFEE